MRAWWCCADRTIRPGRWSRVWSVEWFLSQIPSDTVVLLDEAYIEFVASRYRIDGPDLVRRFPNVVVLRTFSKAYGLAGLRIGYGFAAPELAGRLWTMQLPFGMSNVSVAAVAASYDAEAQLSQRIRRITSERNHLRLRLMAMGVYSMDSHANFVYLPMARRPWSEVFADSRPAGPLLPRRWRADHRRRTAVDAGGAVRGGKVPGLGPGRAAVLVLRMLR